MAIGQSKLAQGALAERGLGRAPVSAPCVLAEQIHERSDAMNKKRVIEKPDWTANFAFLTGPMRDGVRLLKEGMACLS